MSDESELRCPVCGVRACSAEPGSKEPPAFCPMPDAADLLASVEQKYLSDEALRKFAVESARTEAAGYCRSTRVEEIMDFARRMGYRRLGIAHCAGLMHEAKIARDIFHAGGFEVHAVCCKVGSIDKEAVGLVYKLQVNIPEEQRPRRTPAMVATHADSTNMGISSAASGAIGEGIEGAEPNPMARASQAGTGSPVQTVKRTMPKVGRNDPCPCGSGKKYKKCHGVNE